MVGCLLCGKGTTLVLDLGSTPLANELRTTLEPQERYPLHLVRCVECGHLQLDHHVSPEKLYGPGYVYTTANPQHMTAYAIEMFHRFDPSFVVDIGGNDGYFLSKFPQGVTVMNVDPAAGDLVPRMSAMFDERAAEDVVARQGQADLITCNNCFAHNPDLGPIVRGVKKLLSPQGVFVIEVAYALPMLVKGLFDLIYHEHVHYWLLRTLSKYLLDNGLPVVDAQAVDAHGGSLRVVAATDGRPISGRAQRMLDREAEELGAHAWPACGDVGLYFLMYATDEIGTVLGRLRDASLGVLGYPAKACTYLSACGIQDKVQAVYDDNPNKIGKYSHGGVVIEPVAGVSRNEQSHLLVCSWNYADDMMRRVRGYGFKGEFILPHPPRVVS